MATPKNIILVDTRVNLYETIVSAINLELCIPIVFDYYNETLENIKTKIAEAISTNPNTGTINTGRCIGLVQHNYKSPFYNLVSPQSEFQAENTPLENVLLGVEYQDPTLETWSELRNFISWCKTTPEVNATYFDMMACALYSDTNWKYVIDTLTTQTGVTIRASTDDTGAASLGGDWFLESHTGVNLKDVYFTDVIDEFYGILGVNSGHTMMLSSGGTNGTGTVYGCGTNRSGQLGTGDLIDRTTLTAVTTLPNNRTPVEIAAGSDFTIVRMIDSFLSPVETIWGCGTNNVGQIGIGTNSSVSSFTKLNTTNWPNKSPRSVSCGIYHTIVFMTDGTIFGTGYNGSGGLGLGDYTNRNILTQMNNATGKTPVQVITGGSHTVVLMNDGTIYATGWNASGQLGNGTTSNTNTLTLMTNNTGKIPILIRAGEHQTVVLMADYSIYVTGGNFWGQLGIGTNGTGTNVNTLTLVNNTNWSGKVPRSISCGNNHMIVLMRDGTIFGTGLNFHGEIGNGNNTNRNTLGLISNTTGKTIRTVSCGGNHTMFLMTDGTVWGIGYNGEGALADGTTANRNVLTQLTASSTYNIYQLYDTENTSIVLDTNGVTLKYVGISSAYVADRYVIVEANPMGTGMEWFSVASNGSVITSGGYKNEENIYRPYQDWIEGSITTGTIAIKNTFLPPGASTLSHPKLLTVAESGNLVAHYKFDSNANDSSSNNNNITNVNSVTFNTTDYKRGSAAASFNGSNYFEIANDGKFSPDNLTVALWIKPKTSTVYQSISSCRASGPFKGWMLYISPISAGNNLEIWSSTDGTNFTGQVSLYNNFGSLNTWVHLAFTLNKSTSALIVYINGTAFTTTTLGYTNNTATNLRIGAGANETSAQFFLSNGTLMDDFRIYNKVLTDSEINTLVSSSISDNAISSTGQYQLVSVYNGSIRVSNDFGNTWTSKLSSKQFQGVAISSSGQYQSACVYGEGIYTSADYGVTWNQTSSVNRNHMAIKVSVTGQYQTCVADNNFIVTSSDYGQNWTQMTSIGSKSYYDIAMSYDGNIQYAVALNGGGILKTTDKWQTSTSINTGFYQYKVGAIEMSWDGTYITILQFTDAGVNDIVLLSSNGGTTWRSFDPDGNTRTSWTRSSVTMTANGKYQIITYSSGMYISWDYGSTWTKNIYFTLFPSSTSLSRDGTYGLISNDSVDLYRLNTFSPVPVGNIITTRITSMASWFYNSTTNPDITSWDTSNVTNMSATFRSTTLTRSINNWNVSKVTTMSNMFIYSTFNLPLNNWNTLNVTNMNDMFGTTPFNQNISNWNVDKVSQYSGFSSSLVQSNKPLFKSNPQFIGSFTVPTSKSITDSPFNITSAPSSSVSNGAVTYSSNSPSIATIHPTSGLITVVSSGNVTFVATISATSQYWSEFKTSNTLTILPAPTFGPFTLGPKSGIYDLSDSNFSLTAPTSNSSGLFSYTSDNSAVAIIRNPAPFTTTNLLARYDASVASGYTLSGSNVTQWNDLTGNGYHLTQNGTGPTLTTIKTNNALNFDSGRGLTRSSVPLADAITIFMVIKYGTNIRPYGNFMHHGNRDSDWSIERDGNNSRVIFESGSNNNVVVDVTNNTNYILIGRIVGTTRQFWRYSDTQPTVFSSGTPIALLSGTKSVYVGRSDFYQDEGCNSSIGEILYYNASISNADVSANLLYLQNKWFQGLPSLSYSVSLISYGYANITATQDACGSYVSKSVTSPLTVYGNIASTFSSSTFTVASSKTFGDPSFGITPPLPTSNSSGVITYSSSNTNVATIDLSGNFITVVGAGDVSFNATQAATIQYASGIKTSNILTVARGTSTLSAASFAVASNKTFGDASFSFSSKPTSNSSGAITYSSSNTSVATVDASGTTVTLVGAGDVSFNATQAQTNQYNASTKTSNTLTVARGTSTLSAASFSVASNKTLGDASFSFSTKPTSNSSGAITYSSSNTNVATVDPSGTFVTLVGVGDVSFNATQAETNQYNAATKTSNTLTVAQGTTILAFANPPTTKNVTDLPFAVTASSASSAAVTYSSSNTAIATVGASTGVVTLKTAGTVTITASQVANANYQAPANTTYSIVITAAGTALQGQTVSPGASFASVDLSGASLAGTTVSGVSFSGANLSNVNFSGAVITNANFSNANISGATNLPTFSTVQKLQLLKNINNVGIGAVQVTAPVSGSDINALLATPISEVAAATFTIKAPTTVDASANKLVTVNAGDISGGKSIYIPINTSETVKINDTVYSFNGTNLLDSCGNVIHYLPFEGKPFKIYAGSVIALNAQDAMNKIKVNNNGLYDVLSQLFNVRTI